MPRIKDAGKSEAGQANASDDPTAAARNRMVDRHLVERGIKNKAGAQGVPDRAPASLPPAGVRIAWPYDDESIPIGEGQTITPPYDVAFMTEVLDPKPTDRVYEVGTGSGYQSAILSRLVKEVYSVEIHAAAQQARHPGPQGTGLYEYPYSHRRRLRGLARCGSFRCDHRHLCPGEDPSAADRPAQGWRPDGDPPGEGPLHSERLPLSRSTATRLTRRELKPTLFVPMTGRAQREAAEARAKARNGEKEAPKNP